MKKFAYVLMALLIIAGFAGDNHAGDTPDLKGKKFLGRPTGIKSGPGCEGCGQPGYFSFSATGAAVEFIWPRGDEIGRGSYTVSGRKLSIRAADGGVFLFSISGDWREIVHLKDKKVYRDEKFPWK